MILTVGNAHTHVSGTSEDISWLGSFLSFDDEATRYRDGGRGRAAPQSKVLLSRATSTFPSGLVPLVVREATAEGLDVQLREARTVPCAADPSADLRWLRPYQRDAVDAVIARARGVLVLATGGGKTEVAIALTRALPCRWLFLVHRDTLRVQTAERFDLRAIEHGRPERARTWDASQRDPWASGARFVVASFQGLAAARKRRDPAYHALLRGVEGLIVDEAHTLPADTFYDSVMDSTGAYYRVGLSATPFARGDKRSVLLLAAVGPALYKLPAQTLIDAGVLAQPRVEFHAYAQPARFRTWANVERGQIVESDGRNALVASLAQRADKPALVFVHQLAHVGRLVRALGARGVTAVGVTGREDTATRRNAVTRLVRGDVDVIVCTVVFQEGLDVPSLASIINASGGKSTIAAIQRAGRALRVAPGKSHCTIYDVDDRGVPMLARHTSARRRAYAGQGYPVTTAPTVARDLPSAAG